MCLYLNSIPKIHYAEEDIYVFKIVSNIPGAEGACRSAYMDFIYAPNTVYYAGNNLKAEIDGWISAFHTTNGFYSYSTFIPMEQVGLGVIDIGVSDNKHTVRLFNKRIALFKIPKGTGYIFNDYIYVSSRIMYLGIAEPIETVNSIIKFIKNNV